MSVTHTHAPKYPLSTDKKFESKFVLKPKKNLILTEKKVDVLNSTTLWSRVLFYVCYFIRQCIFLETVYS